MVLSFSYQPPILAMNPHHQPPLNTCYTSSLPQCHYYPLPQHLTHEDLMLNYNHRVYYLDHHHHHSQPLRPPPQPPPFSQPYSSPFQSLSQIYSSSPPSQFSPSPQWQTPNTPPHQLSFAGHTPVRDSFSEIREKLLKLKVDLATTPKLIPISKDVDDAYVWEGKHRSENREKSKEVPYLNKSPPFHTQPSPLEIAYGNKENKKKACHVEPQRSPWSPPQAPPLASSPEMVPPSPGLASNENKGREEESAIPRRESPRAPPRKPLPPPSGIPSPMALPEVTSAEIAKLFPPLFGQPSAVLVPSDNSDAPLPVYHSGGQAPGGYNVFSGIFAKGSTLWLQRLCSGKDKIATPEQFTQAQETAQELVGLCGQKPNFTISSIGHCYSGFNLAFESDYLALENYYSNAENSDKCYMFLKYHKGFNLEDKVNFEGVGNDRRLIIIKIKIIIRSIWRKGIG